MLVVKGMGQAEVVLLRFVAGELLRTAWAYIKICCSLGFIYVLMHPNQLLEQPFQVIYWVGLW